jgi:hypothetical protein
MDDKTWKRLYREEADKAGARIRKLEMVRDLMAATLKRQEAAVAKAEAERDKAVELFWELERTDERYQGKVINKMNDLERRIGADK